MLAPGWTRTLAVAAALPLAVAQTSRGRAVASEPAVVARAMPGGYLGAEACGACHREALATWRGTAHARSSAALSSAERARRACQACHATGDAPAAPAIRAAVECEACHGPGEGYAADDVMRDRPLALALGLRDLGSGAARAALCLGCHAVDRTAFVTEAAWRRIAH
jgi:hypothetical protein